LVGKAGTDHAKPRALFGHARILPPMSNPRLRTPKVRQIFQFQSSELSAPRRRLKNRRTINSSWTPKKNRRPRHRLLGSVHDGLESLSTINGIRTPNATLGTMRKETGKTSVAAVTRAAKKR
jgi:hypothetical protein